MMKDEVLAYEFTSKEANKSFDVTINEEGAVCFSVDDLYLSED